ncbi:MAG: calcium/proton exchanger [Anaerolineae bacterium]
MVRRRRETSLRSRDGTRGLNTVVALALAAPVAVAAQVLSWPPPIAFAAAAAGLVPASKLLGDATEDLALRAGPRVGGLLNALLGTASLLIIAVFALDKGLLDLVKATITGSILGYLLVVIGLSAFLGGVRNGTQYFDRQEAGMSATLMILSVVALSLPAMYGQLVPDRNSGPVESFSEAVAILMLVVYLLSVYYSLFWRIEEQAIAGVHQLSGRWPAAVAGAALVSALLLIVVLAKVLVDAIGPTVEATAMTEFFVGMVVIPLVGSVSEHLLAFETAWRNRMDVSMSIALGSSIQVALYVAPLLVFASLILGHPMDLIFTQIELVALAAAALVTTLVAFDGESNWLEGVMVLAVYTLLVLAFFWWP